jgi:hypothetical protein
MTVVMMKSFARFARKAGLEGESLKVAAANVAAGKFDADLGGGVYKQRIARPGGGKSGGFRTIILFKLGGHSVFAHGFAKNQKANVSAKELEGLKKLANLLLGLSNREMDESIEAGELVKVE